MSENLERLREAGVLHKTHQFSKQETDAIESLSGDEVEALISAKQKLGDDLIKKTDDGDDTQPNTMIL